MENFRMKLDASSEVTVLNFDPAPKNHGFCVFTVKTNAKGKIYKIEIRKVGIIQNTINAPKQGVIEQQQAFSREIRGLVNKYTPDYICLERFLSRGRGGALTAECANLQIGSILEIARSKKIPVNIVLAVTWKTAMKKALTRPVDNGGKALNKKAANNGGIEYYYKLNPKCLHPIDAFLIGIYFIQGCAFLNTHDISRIERRLAAAR